MRLAMTLVQIYAVALLLAGALLLFAPEAAAPLANAADPSSLALTQLLSAALLGFGAANWTGRGVILGGIYGRALVVGNQAFAFVGVLVLGKGVPAGAGPVVWGLLALLACGAVLYSVLLYRPPAPPDLA